MVTSAPGNTTLNSQRDPYATGVISNMLGQATPGASISAPSNASDGGISGWGSGNAGGTSGWSGGTSMGGTSGGFNSTPAVPFLQEGGAIDTGDAPRISAPDTMPSSPVDQVRGALGYDPVSSRDDQMTTAGTTQRGAAAPPPDDNILKDPIDQLKKSTGEDTGDGELERLKRAGRALDTAGKLWGKVEDVLTWNPFKRSPTPQPGLASGGAIDTGMGPRRPRGPRSFNPRHRMAVHAHVQRALDFGRQKHGLTGGGGAGPAIGGAPPPDQWGVPPGGMAGGMQGGIPMAGMPPGGPPGAPPPGMPQQFRNGGMVRAFQDGGDNDEQPIQQGAIPDVPPPDQGPGAFQGMPPDQMPEQPQQPPPPPAQRGVLAYLSGADAATPQQVQAVQQRIDPHDEMTPNDRATAAVATASAVDPSAGWGVLQHFRNAYEHAKQFAAHAFDQGDTHAGVNAANVAFGNVPNTKHFHFVVAGRDPSAGVNMTVTDQSGRSATTHFSQEKLAGLMKDRSTMFDAMADMNPVGRMGHGNLGDVASAGAGQGDITGATPAAPGTAAPADSPVNRALRAVTGYGSVGEYLNRPPAQPSPAAPQTTAAIPSPGGVQGYAGAGASPAATAAATGPVPPQVLDQYAATAGTRTQQPQPQGGDVVAGPSEAERFPLTDYAGEDRQYNLPPGTSEMSHRMFPQFSQERQRMQWVAGQMGGAQERAHKENIADIGARWHTQVAETNQQTKLQQSKILQQMWTDRNAAANSRAMQSAATKLNDTRAINATRAWIAAKTTNPNMTFDEFNEYYTGLTGRSFADDTSNTMKAMGLGGQQGAAQQGPAPGTLGAAPAQAGIRLPNGRTIIRGANGKAVYADNPGELYQP